MPTRGIPYPTGDPDLGPDEERKWRRELLEQALAALTTPVEGPTVFDPSAAGDEVGVR